MKGLFGKFIVILVIAMNIWFTNRVLNVFEATSVEPAVLIGAFFAFTTGELWLLAGIKKSGNGKEKLGAGRKKKTSGLYPEDNFNLEE